MPPKRSLEQINRPLEIKEEPTMGVDVGEILASMPSLTISDIEATSKNTKNGTVDKEKAPKKGALGAKIALNSLQGLSFVVAGELPTFGRVEVQSFIMQHGGKVTSAISDKTSCLIVGEVPGISKIEKAKGFNVTILNENGFIDFLAKISTNTTSTMKGPHHITSPVGSNTSAGKPSTTPGTSNASNMSATEVLQSIPSVPLPEIGGAPNFQQIAARTDKSSGAQFNAAPNCLTGLTFVVTGVLPTLGREEVQSLIKRYGGKVTSSLSGKTSCLVLGEDAGPSKIQKAKSLKLKVIDEQGFIDLLEKMPAEGGSGADAERARLKRKREEEEIIAHAAKLKKEMSGAADPIRKEHNTNTADHASVLWTTKYSPRTFSDVCGNQSSLQKLKKWLENWESARHGKYKGEGSLFRAAMLSGPPGIGKTTAAHLVGKMLGFDIIEYNASDTRSKGLLNQQVSQTLSNRSIGAAKTPLRTRKIMVIMDEVDGMSAGDRGGVGAMAALARTTNVPLVLICNERTLPKMRPFDRVVFDVKFFRPQEADVRRRMMTIAAAEGLKLDPATVTKLLSTTGADIRQMLVLLETYNVGQQNSNGFVQSWNKEIVLKPFDIAGKLLGNRSLPTRERMELYFHDYDFAPLMIQENYLSTCSSIAAAADASGNISDSDLVDKRIHGPQQQWSLMPLHALLSCAAPSYYAAGSARGRFNFTSYLGNNSKGTKYRRLLAELRSHMRLKIPVNAADLRLDVQPPLAAFLLGPLLSKGQEAIPEIIDLMDNYYLTKEDFDVVMELGVGANNTEDLAKSLPTQVKTAFTRKYNAASHPLPFMKMVDTKIAAQPKQTPDFDDVISENLDDAAADTGVEPTENDADALEKAVKGDKYIKAKAKPKQKASTKSSSKAKVAAKPKAATKRKNTT